MIMSRVFLLIGLYFLTLFQLGFWSHLAIDGVWPNLVLLAVLLVALSSKNKGLIWLAALWGGFLLDIFYYHQIGLAILTFIILISLLSLSRRFFALEGMMGTLIYLAVFSLAYEPVRYIISFIFTSSPVLSFDLFFLVAQTVYHLVLVLIFWLILPVKFRRIFSA